MQSKDKEQSSVSSGHDEASVPTAAPRSSLCATDRSELPRALGLVERLRNGGQPDLADMAEELLEACRAIVAWDDAEKNAKPWAEDNGAGWWARLGMCADAFDKARAAISKATGGSQ